MDEIKIIEMTGSEKQIAWATDIIRLPYVNMMLQAEHFDQLCQSEHANVCRNAAKTYRESYENAADVNPNMVSAAWIIDYRHIFSSAMEQAICMAAEGTSCKPYEFKAN